MVKEYSLKKDGEKALAPNFRVREFACRDGTDTVLVDEELVRLLQAVRSHFGRPVRVTSGYRTQAHNRAVGGSPHSRHLSGQAADIQVDGVSVEDAAAYAETLLPATGGIGRYPPRQGRAAGWLHLDTRESRSRWRL